VIRGFGGNVSLDSVISEICYVYICVLKYFSNICDFFANLGKCSPLLFGYFYLWVSCLVLFGFWNFPWLDCEGIIK
jgi:hypothetical protein